MFTMTGRRYRWGKGDYPLRSKAVCRQEARMKLWTYEKMVGIKWDDVIKVRNDLKKCKAQQRYTTTVGYME